MEYNTQKEGLIISEYGRNIQNLVKECKKIEDKEERQKTANAIASLMIQMHPQHKNLMEYRDKIWKHLFRIAEYDLDVDTPSGEVPSMEADRLKPEQIAYHVRNDTFRHYGSYLKAMINKAIAMEDEEKKAAFAKVIGSFMKMAYRNWNKEDYVSDEIIKNDIKTISDGKLIIPDETSLDGLLQSISHKKRRDNHKSNRNHGGRHKSNRNYKRRK